MRLPRAAKENAFGNGSGSDHRLIGESCCADLHDIIRSRDRTRTALDGCPVTGRIPRLRSRRRSSVPHSVHRIMSRRVAILESPLGST